MKRIVALMLLLGTFCSLKAQLPVELFAGDKRASFDLMFFRFFRNSQGDNGKVLFFSRERAVIDYQQTTQSNLPQFGFTEALSYNHPALKGFAPVLTGMALNRGVFAKAGLQYARITPAWTIFGWSVLDLAKRPNLDLFLLMRFTPKLWGKWNLFSQAESINTLPFTASGAFAIAQRVRVGLKRGEWQFGLGGDFASVGRGTFSSTQNTGLFLRHEF